MSRSRQMSDSTDMSISDSSRSCLIVDLRRFFIIFSLENDLSADADVKGRVRAILIIFDKLGKHSGSWRSSRYKSTKDGFRSFVSLARISLIIFEERINFISSSRASALMSSANQSAACLTCSKESGVVMRLG